MLGQPLLNSWMCVHSAVVCNKMQSFVLRLVSLYLLQKLQSLDPISAVQFFKMASPVEKGINHDAPTQSAAG